MAFLTYSQTAAEVVTNRPADNSEGEGSIPAFAFLRGRSLRSSFPDLPGEKQTDYTGGDGEGGFPCSCVAHYISIPFNTTQVDYF